MRHKLTVSTPVKVMDYNGHEVRAAEFLMKLDGIACHGDTVLNYCEADIEDREQFRGGFLRLTFDDTKKRLRLAIEIDTPRKLSRKELAALTEDLRGQITDGIGVGGFDSLSAKTTLSVAVCFPFRVRCVQTVGVAWKPRKVTAAANERKYAALQRLIASEHLGATSRPAQFPAAPSKAPSAKETKSFQALFRLLSKVDRDKLIEQIQAVLTAVGGELSGVRDRELPGGNWTSPRLLKLLLNAGLDPELLDENGCTQLYRAAGTVECVRFLLDRGVNVNRQSEDVYRSTALMRAASLGSVKSVETLLEASADPNIVGEFDTTALTAIDRHTPQREKIEALLRAAGATR